MNNYLTKIFEELKNIKLNRNLLTFLIFLIVSSFFWFLNAVNKQYYADIYIPVRYVNMPDDKLVIGDLSNELKIKINAYGHEIMNYKASKFKPVVVNLKKHQVHIVDQRDEQRYYILTTTLKDEISAVLGSDMDIKKIEPDSLIFKLEEVISKKVPVVSNLKLNFKPQYKLKNKLRFYPDSVTIKGEKSRIDTIFHVQTNYLEINEVSDSTVFSLNINEIKGTEVKPNKVNCTLETEKFTEISYQLPIQIINEPENYNVKLFPATVKLTFNVGFSKYNKVHKEQFSVVANYEKINGEPQKLPVKLMSKPNYVSDIRIVPKLVDYIIEKND